MVFELTINKPHLKVWKDGDIGIGCSSFFRRGYHVIKRIGDKTVEHNVFGNINDVIKYLNELGIRWE